MVSARVCDLIVAALRPTVPSTRERLLFLSFFVSIGRCNGVGEGLCPAAVVISLN